MKTVIFYKVELILVVLVVNVTYPINLFLTGSIG
jgi:hypothetical protein